MPSNNQIEERGEAGTNPRRLLGAIGLPPAWALAYGGILLTLAVGTAMLMQRGQTREESSRGSSRGQALAELITQAVATDVSFRDSQRLLPILESAVRVGDLEAGAVLDDGGTIIAHTDVSRIGTRLQSDPTPNGPDGRPSPALVRELFGRDTGRVFIRPLLGVNGPAGKVVLELPESADAAFLPGMLKFLLPAGLLLLALVGLSQATLRSFTKPTLVCLERLTSALESNAEPPSYVKLPSRRESDRLIAEAVSRIDALTEARDDLTFRNRLLGYEKKRTEQMLDCLPDGLITTDSRDKILFMNPAAARIAGLTKEEGQRRDSQGLPPFLAEGVRGADRAGQAAIAAPHNGGTRQILVSRIPLAVSDDRSMGNLYVLRDVTAQQAAHRTQAEFLSQVSHELKAPLHTILTYVEMLAEDGLVGQEERRQFYNTLSAETARMAQLINNLLQLSRIQMGDLSGKFGFVKPANLVREQSESLRTHAESRGLTIEVKVPDNMPAVRGDKDLLGVAVTNLVSNAIKYTPKGGTITVRAFESEGGLAVEVEDTGIGIPDDVRPHLFQRFFRSQQEEVQQQKGSGLGLSLVKEIVEAHEGQVSVESHLGKGSCFRLWLPCLEASSKLDLLAA